MNLRQYLHSNPVGASCLFGCSGRAAAAVVKAEFVRAMTVEIPPLPPNAADIRAMIAGTQTKAA